MKRSNAETNIALFVSLISLVASIVSGQTRESQAPPPVAVEQRSFSAEDDHVTRPIKMPDAITRALARDTDIKQILTSENIAPDQMPPSWFLTSEVHLSGTDEKDILVIGSGPLLGANVATFWVFRPEAGGFALILKAPAHNLNVKDTRSRGYHDIELISATADRVSQIVCRFDGSIYKRSTGSSTKVP